LCSRSEINTIDPNRVEGWLRSLGVAKIFIAGLATDYCVRASAIDARALGFPVALVQDACRGVDFPVGSVAKALDDMARAGVRLVSAAEVS